MESEKYLWKKKEPVRKEQQAMQVGKPCHRETNPREVTAKNQNEELLDKD